MHLCDCAQAAPTELYQRLVAELDTEGRYLLLNAMANQLRYPNSHTYYYVCLVLLLYETAQLDIAREQISRCVEPSPAPVATFLFPSRANF